MFSKKEDEKDTPIDPEIKANGPQPKEKPKKEKTVSIQIRGMRNGAGMTYACGGLHLAAEHRCLLPKVTKKDSLGREREQAKRKIVPGVVYELPKSVADIYLNSSPDFLEVVR